MNVKDVLHELNVQLELGNEVGIFYDRHSYDIIINGNGQNPIIPDIGKDIFYFLYRNHYLTFSQMTKVGSHWYYGFTTETRGGLSLYDLYSYNDFPFLLNKKFYIVPRGKSRVYYHDATECNNKESEPDENGSFTIEPDYNFTKIKDHATVYDIDKLFCTYMYGSNPFWRKTYCTHYATVGWQGAQCQFVKQNSNYYVEDKNGEIEQKENYAREFDLLPIDGSERYYINDIFTIEDRDIGSLQTSEEQLEERRKKIIDNKLNYNVTFSIGTKGGSMWSLPYSYFKAEYMCKKENKVPFSIINKEEV